MRLFYGLALPDVVRAETARLSKEAAALMPGRYLDPVSHHLTLAFIGEVDESRMTDVQNILTDVLSRFPVPRVTLTGTDFFKRPQNGILIVRAECALAPLHDALCEALIRSNLPVDPKPFAAHITLARHVSIDPQALGSLTPKPLSFSPAQAHIFLSTHNEQGGPLYTPIFSASFAP